MSGAYSYFNDSGVLEALAHGADINAPRPIDRNMTVLHYAARNGSRHMVGQIACPINSRVQQCNTILRGDRA